uniref:UmuC domain-containing protein n=1 Tax=Romanomermis culicivorax TaxID=13658 RepID=A0A915KHT2_ROMCU
MFLGDALKLCPELKTLSYDFEDYKRVSKLFYETVASFTLDIEAVSCDEMFVNMKDIILETNSDPLIIAATIRRTIFEATGCTSSAGLGRNKLIARLATRKAKPNGQYIVRDVEIDGFLGSTSVHDLPESICRTALFLCNLIYVSDFKF